MAFDDEGGLQEVDFHASVVETVVAGGKAFMTDGCPDRAGEMACNRPFGSYRPSEPYRDYPFLPRPGDQAVIQDQLALTSLVKLSPER